MNGHVKPHELGEHGVLVADHLGEVVGPILGGVDGAGGGALSGISMGESSRIVTLLFKNCANCKEEHKKIWFR